MANNSSYATCTRKECFAYRAEWNRHINVCTILWNNDFVGGANNCPFFKTIGQFRADKEYYRPMEKAYLAKKQAAKAKEDK